MSYETDVTSPRRKEKLEQKGWYIESLKQTNGGVVVGNRCDYLMKVGKRSCFKTDKWKLCCRKQMWPLERSDLRPLNLSPDAKLFSFRFNLINSRRPLQSILFFIVYSTWYGTRYMIQNSFLLPSRVEVQPDKQLAATTIYLAWKKRFIIHSGTVFNPRVRISPPLVVNTDSWSSVSGWLWVPPGLTSIFIYVSIFIIYPH